MVDLKEIEILRESIATIDESVQKVQANFSRFERDFIKQMNEQAINLKNEVEELMSES